MERLSYTQEFYLVSVNEKGKMRTLERHVCFVVGGMMELLEGGYIERDIKNRLVAARAWDDELAYLKPLYDRITTRKKPRDMREIALDYMDTWRIRPLMQSVGASLAARGLAEEIAHKKPKKVRYAPKPEAAAPLLEKVRAVRKDGSADDGTLCLLAMMDRGNMLRKLFGKEEGRALRDISRKSEQSASIKPALDYILLYVSVAIILIVFMPVFVNMLFRMLGMFG